MRPPCGASCGRRGLGFPPALPPGSCASHGRSGPDSDHARRGVAVKGGAGGRPTRATGRRQQRPRSWAGHAGHGVQRWLGGRLPTGAADGRVSPAGWRSAAGGRTGPACAQSLASFVTAEKGPSSGSLVIEGRGPRSPLRLYCPGGTTRERRPPQIPRGPRLPPPLSNLGWLSRTDGSENPSFFVGRIRYAAQHIRQGAALIEAP